MSHSLKIIGLAALFIAAVLAMMAVLTPAGAIECRGRFQVVNGNLISTPYCEDNHLGAVARRYGLSASNQAIRNNPNFKEDVCSTVGHDTRVQGICDQYNGDGGGVRR